MLRLCVVSDDNAILRLSVILPDRSSIRLPSPWRALGGRDGVDVATVRPWTPALQSFKAARLASGSVPNELTLKKCAARASIVDYAMFAEHRDNLQSRRRIPISPMNSILEQGAHCCDHP